MHLCFEARLPLADETWKFLADEWGRFVSFCDPFLPINGMTCKANCARQLLIRNAKAHRILTADPIAGRLLQHQALPGALDTSFGSWVFRFRAQQESTTDHFVAFVGKRNSLGIGMPPCFLGHP
jgi:hypothetical protein